MNFRSIVLMAGTIACFIVQPASAAESAKTKETVLHSFGNGTDGQNPTASLIDVKGTLYGTTSSGGAFGDGGTLFALDPMTGVETVLYSFCSQQNCTDGVAPTSSLIDVGGVLYGVTIQGGNTDTCGYNGKLGCGTVFAVNHTTGSEKVLYSFCSQQNCADGQSPNGGLVYVGGLLYGTTNAGGSFDGGTLFSLDPLTGVEKVLYSFCNQQNCTDGGGPNENLIYLNGTLYGTLYGGGNAYNGAVFAFQIATGSESTVYKFCNQQNCADGANPYAGLLAANGLLYGTTLNGGTPGCSGTGCGTVFAVDPNTGAEAVVYSFCSQKKCEDGEAPQSGLIEEHGILYGTTGFGGLHCGMYDNCGTVFALNPTSGVESVLYSFCSKHNCVDGATPGSGLIDIKGSLYGTTEGGGAYCLDETGCGVVFSVKRR